MPVTPDQFSNNGYSSVAGGAGDVIAANTARRYIWDSNTSLWYRMA